MKTGKKMWVWGMGLIMLAGSCATAWAEEKAEEKKDEPKPYSSVAATFASKYIWRGYEMSKDSMVIQPSATVGYRGFEFNVWGNLDTNDQLSGANKAKWNETDMTLSYTYDTGPVKLTGGYIYYAFSYADDSQELFLKLAGNCLLTPTLSIYREIANYPGWYFNLGVSHSFNLTKEITLDLGASVGYQASDTDKIVQYNSQYLPTNNKYNAFHDGQVSVGLTIPFAKYFSVKPMVAYNFPLSDDAKNRIKGTSLSNNYDFFWGGVTFAASF